MSIKDSAVNCTRQGVIPSSVGSRLREQRDALGLSQAVLAARCGVSRRGVINFEQDENLPGGAFLIETAKLGVDVAYVLTGKLSPRNDEESGLLQKFRALPDSDRVLVMRTLEKNAPKR